MDCDIIRGMRFYEPKFYLDETFTVRSYEAGVTNHVSLPTLCNFMQEIAGLNAEKLGWGIRKLQEEGLTWMLSRLHLKVARYVPWGEKITLRTWPSGMKGRLIATRCFQGADGAGGEVLQAHSEWLYVDMRAQKIAKLPESFAELVPADTPDILFDDIGGKFTQLPAVTSSVEIRVRQSDLDFNDHVNNVHYVEWMLETMPLGTDPADRGIGGLNQTMQSHNLKSSNPPMTLGTGPAEMDVVFRAAAKAGDTLISECFHGEGRTLHLIRRPADGLVLATAAMVWA